ncbi:MAG: hypothetical protein IT580_15380 [Verrucomicrobiales bacterium]|nr:hypothetical protein [Verrucomicrobiales bacterium]
MNPYEALPTHSFSEVATVKLALENLLQDHIRALHTRGSPTTPADRYEPLRTDPQATYRLEQLIREFAGTDQALVMTGMLLSTLKRQEDWQRWLDVYLATAYERPTSLLATSFLNRARLIARDVGREEEIDRLERHLAEIPAGLSTFPLCHPGRAERIPTP